MAYNPIVKLNPGSVKMPKRVSMGKSFDMNVSNPSTSSLSQSSTFSSDEAPDYLQAAAGGIGLAGDFFNISNQRLNLGNPDMDFGDVPSYNLGEYVNQTYSAQSQGANLNEVLGGVGKGAAAGSAFGPVGSVIGGAVGGVSNFLAGGRRKKKQQGEIRKARRKAFSAQQNYNKAASDYNTNQMAMTEYYRNQNPYEREAALY